MASSMRLVFCAVAVLLSSFAARADHTVNPPPQMLITGLPKSGALSLEELKSLGPTEQTWVAHGTSHKVFGVRLDKLLAAHGFTPGKMGKDVPKTEKRAGWRKVVLLTAADGFQSLISCAEMSEEMGPTLAMLVWKIDGEPLEAGQGPVRLVVLTDKEPSRSIYGLYKIEVVDVPSLVKRGKP